MKFIITTITAIALAVAPMAALAQTAPDQQFTEADAYNLATQWETSHPNTGACYSELLQLPATHTLTTEEVKQGRTNFGGVLYLMFAAAVYIDNIQQAYTATTADYQAGKITQAQYIANTNYLKSEFASASGFIDAALKAFPSCNFGQK